MMYEIRAVRVEDRKGCTLRGWWQSDRAMRIHLKKWGYELVSYISY